MNIPPFGDGSSRTAAAGASGPAKPPGVSDPRPAVIFLNNDLGTGGAERAMINYVNHLRCIRPVVAVLGPARGLAGDLKPSIEVVSLAAPARPPLPAAQPGDKLRLPGQSLGRMLLELPGLLVKAWRLVRVCRRHDASTVVTFLNRAHTVALVARWLFAPRLRVVINVHETPSQHLAINFGPLERRIMRAFIRLTFPRAALVITVCQSVREDLVEHFGLRRDRIAVAFNPIDLCRVRRAGQMRPPGAETAPGPRIVAVGRLGWVKGFDLLIRAVARLPRPLGARLEIVGEGEERPKLEALIRTCGLQDRVRLVGRQSNPWQYIAGADVVALGSRTEAFPTVIGEAFALARPVVATRCSNGIGEYLEEGRCGLLVPPGDVDAMAAALEQLLTDPGLRLALGREGAGRVEAFDLPGAVERYEGLLTKVVHG